MTTRRTIVKGAIALAASALGADSSARAAIRLADSLNGELARIGRESGGRLGVAVLDTGTGWRSGLRAGERFPMCSTFKLMAAAAVLRRVDRGKERLDRVIKFAAGDLVTYSPVTEKHTGDGMTLAALCEAAVTLSDNTAGNLLLANIGGPEGFTAFARALGDRETRLDRIEPALNEAVPGDPRDTTTPSAMLGNLRKLVLGQALSAASKGLLTQWLIGNKTGDARLRAGVPGWRVGDKTGSGMRGTANDIGVIWPPGRAPVVVTVYLTETDGKPERRDATIAAVGRAIAADIGGKTKTRP